MFFDRFPNELLDEILIYLDIESLINLRDINYFRLRVGKLIEDKMKFFDWCVYIDYLKVYHAFNIKYIDVSEDHFIHILKDLDMCYIKYQLNFKNKKDHYRLLRIIKNCERSYYLYHEYGDDSDCKKAFITLKKYRDFEEFLDEIKLLM